MDFNINPENTWDWQGEDYSLQEESNFPPCIWNENPPSEDLSYMFADETTPIKDSVDLSYDVTSSSPNKGPGEREICSRLKRRRMLQFDAEVGDSFLCSEEKSSMFFKSHGQNSYEDVLPEGSEWMPGFSEDRPESSTPEVFDQSSEGWLTECFNDTEMQISPSDLNVAGNTSVQLNVSSEHGDVLPDHRGNVYQQQTTRTSKVVFKGKKSFLRTPTKLLSSVVYPFAIIKPCGVSGDVTLKDINQRIRTPPPSTSEKVKKDPVPVYPTSAFSGKPVVGKTKIRTEGGKGSITIMRTKG